MENLKRSKIKATSGYTFYEIPNTNKVMLAFYSNDLIYLAGWDDRNIWFRLGDRDDLKTKYLPDVKFRTSHYGSDEQSRKEYIKKVLEMFA
jgi:hypothetical protein